MSPYHSRKYLLNENFFSVWSQNMAYVLGFWFADGSMKHSASYMIRFSSADQKHLYKLRQVMGSTNKILQYTRSGKKGNVFDLQIHSKKLYHQLIALGGTKAKSTL